MATLLLTRPGVCSAKLGQYGSRELCTFYKLHKNETVNDFIESKEENGSTLAEKILKLDAETKKELAPCPLEHKSNLPKVELKPIDFAKLPLHYLSLGKARLTCEYFWLQMDSSV